MSEHKLNTIRAITQDTVCLSAGQLWSSQRQKGHNNYVEVNNKFNQMLRGKATTWLEYVLYKKKVQGQNTPDRIEIRDSSTSCINLCLAYKLPAILSKDETDNNLIRYRTSGLNIWPIDTNILWQV